MGILEFKADKNQYVALAEKADAEGNEMGALSALRRAEELAPLDFGVRSRIAAVLVKMGLPDVAEDALLDYIAVRPEPPREAYLTLLHIMLDNGDYGLAEGVLMEAVAEDEDPTDLLTDLYNIAERERYSDEAPLRLVGDEETIEAAETLAAEGRMDEAEELARSMRRSESVAEALRAVIYHMITSGETAGAARLSEELLARNERDGFAAAALIAAGADADGDGRLMRVAAAADPVSAREADCLDDIMRITADCRTIPYFERRLQDTPYDGDIMLTLAELYANDGRPGKARRILADLLAVYPGDSAAVYLMRELSAEDGAARRFAITLQLQPEERAARIALTEKWLSGARNARTAAKAAFADAELTEAIEWLFQSELWKTQSDAAGVLAANARGRIILRRQLMQDIPPLLKRDYVAYLLEWAPEKSVPVIFGYVYKRVELQLKPEGEFRQAYIKAFATLAVYDCEDEERKLRKAYEEFVAAYGDAVAARAATENMSDTDGIAALLLYLSRVGPFKTQDNCASAVMIKRRAVKDYYTFYILGRYENERSTND